MSDDNSRYTLGIIDVVTIVFIILKLVGVINWSWWVVLSPVWVTSLVILVGVVLIVAIDEIINKGRL